MYNPGPWIIHYWVRATWVGLRVAHINDIPMNEVQAQKKPSIHNCHTVGKGHHSALVYLPGLAFPCFY